MSRTPVILCLAGLGFSVIGGYLMLRLLMPAHGGMVDQSVEADAGALWHFAGADLLCVYILITASGFAIFAAGMAILWGRRGLS